MKIEFSKDEYKQLKAIGAAFKHLRIAAEYETQEEFADHVGMPRSQYQEYESGINMKIVSISRLASHHNLSLKDFIFLMDDIMCKTEQSKIKKIGSN